MELYRWKLVAGCLQTRKKEHIQENTETCWKGSKIVIDAWLNGRSIHFNNTHVLKKGNFLHDTDFRILAYPNFMQLNRAITWNRYLDRIPFFYKHHICILFPRKYLFVAVSFFYFTLFTVYISKIVDWQLKAQFFKTISKRERFKMSIRFFLVCHQ